MNAKYKTTTGAEGLASTPPAFEPLLVNESDAALLLGGISTRTLWSQTMPRGSIPVVRIGSRVLYSVDALREFIAQQMASSPTA